MVTSLFDYSGEQIKIKDFLGYGNHDLKQGDRIEFANNGRAYALDHKCRVCLLTIFDKEVLMITDSGKIAHNKKDYNSFTEDYFLSRECPKLISLEEAKRLVDKSKALENFR